jgi:integrase
VLGNLLLQKLRATAIDTLYVNMAQAKEISPRTQHHVHTVLGDCLATAHRKGLIPANPMVRVEQVPAPEVFDPDEKTDEIGEGLSEPELATLIAGFKSSSSLFAIVALAAASGARRNELLALRWTDLDVAKKTLRIERALV